MKKLFFLTLLLALIILTGCPDDPVRPDPCEGKKPVTAEIKVFQKVAATADHNADWIETDTLPVEKIVLFEAGGDYQYYEWQIMGDTTRYFTKNKSFLFNEPWGELTIRLIVKSEANINCFPDDDGIDTAYKKILVVNKADLAIVGSYLGYHEDNPTDTFSVEIKYEAGNRGMVMYNINRGCFVPVEAVPFAAYIYLDYCNHYFNFTSEFFSHFVYGCEAPIGRGILDISNNKIVIYKV
jgi:hypothetical protein